ncbi:hypothetical protein BGW42_000768 [Actinomortierella wolfii]|nr:hypothetical protein BGW42_000768 [Actinomortierella wolfii]
MDSILPKVASSAAAVASPRQPGSTSIARPAQLAQQRKKSPLNANTKLVTGRQSPGSPSPAVAGAKESLTELVQQARTLYISKQYALALQALNRALVLSPNEINLLDTRAACHEKLGRLDTALTDAKAIIQHHAKNPKGYLRAARILRIQKRYPTACKIYKAGIDRSDKTHKDYSSLDRLLKDLELIMENEARVLDPFVLLPLELILMIFDMIPFEKRCLCTLVSKRWRSTLSAVPRFWTMLDFSLPRPPPPEYNLHVPLAQDLRSNSKVNNLSVLAAAKHASPRHLILGANQNITKGLFTQLIKLRRTRALERLCLRQNYKITDQELSLLWSSTPALRSLELSDVYGVTDLVATALLERCRQLEELDLSECRVSESVLVMSLAKSGPMTTLRKLTFGRRSIPFGEAGVSAMVGMFPELTVLDLRSLCVSDMDSLYSLWRLSKLERLYLDGIQCTREDMALKATMLWMRGMKQLQSFQLKGCQGVTEGVAAMIFHPSFISPAYASTLTPPGIESDPLFPPLSELGSGWTESLRMLDLSYSPYLVLDGIIDSTTPFLPNLHTLILNACGGVREQDVCELLASTGQKLCRFEFSRNAEATNQVLYTLRDHCPSIQYVNVAYTLKVTGLGVMALVNHRREELEYLCLDGCQNISADAVDRARYILGQSHRVSFAFPR